MPVTSTPARRRGPTHSPEFEFINQSDTPSPEAMSEALDVIAERRRVSWKRILLLIVAITIHNIPGMLIVAITIHNIPGMSLSPIVEKYTHPDSGGGLHKSYRGGYG